MRLRAPVRDRQSGRNEKIEIKICRFMIQRMQSLYLFLAALLTGLMLALPLGSFLGGPEEMTLTAFGFKDAASGERVLNAYALSATVIASTLLALVTIFLFKRRLVQFRLCVVEMVLLVGVVLFEIYYIWGAAQSLAAFDASAWKLSLAAFFPLLSLIFTYLAMRGVKKDILLVKSLDRIR